MPPRKRTYGRNKGREYLIAEANSLRAMKGTVWIFIGISTLIEYLARLEKGGSLGNKRTKKMPPPPDSMEEYASFIRRRFPKKRKYNSFQYVIPSPTPGANLRGTFPPINGQ